MNYFNTKTIQIGSNTYCVYCGEVAKTDFEYEEYDRIDYYYCNCDGAKAERELYEFQQKLLSRLKENTNKLKEIRYKYELKQLKNKYNIR